MRVEKYFRNTTLQGLLAFRTTKTRYLTEAVLNMKKAMAEVQPRQVYDS